jgi:gamma-tubulin complex component 2
MYTCTAFAAYTGWLARQLEQTDPDLSMAAAQSRKPPGMTTDQWRLFGAQLQQRAARHPAAAAAGGGGGAQSAGDAPKPVAELFEVIQKWETNFSRHLQILLDALNHYAATETVVLLSLCARLSTANQGTEYAGLRHEEEIGS